MLEFYQYGVIYTCKLEARKMENNMYRNTNDINDTEYHRMRKSEDSSYEYHGADAEEIDKEMRMMATPKWWSTMKAAGCMI